MAIIANKWKPVQLDGNFFTNQLCEGLIGIEECTDYDTDNIIISKKRKRKTTSDTVQKKLKKPKSKVQNASKSSSKNGSATEVEENPPDPNDALKGDNLKVWERFSLASPLLKALEEQGFHNPTDIQAFTLPSAILGKRDILGAAETGSGKTLAFGLPILNGILKLKETKLSEEIDESDNEWDEADFSDDEAINCVKAVKLKNTTARKPLYALILTPTRELAIQVKSHLTAIAKYAGIRVAVVVGGMAAVKQERILSGGPEIVVGTPGRLWELVQQGNEHLSQIGNIKFLAIDETDRMLEKGHFKELHDLLERINMNEKSKEIRQNFVFSATLTLIHEIPKHLKNKFKIRGWKLSDMSPEQKLQKIVNTLGVTNPKIVDLSQGKGTSGTLTECRITCAINEKDYYVYYFLMKHPGRTLIFCNSIGCVKRLTTLLTLLNCHPLPLHASMQQRQRLTNLERFRDTENSVLIATDVAARGLDIPKIDHVLHYQIPRTSESYVHRSGRTARASKEGITVLIMEPNEFGNYIKLCKTLEKDEDLPIFPIQAQYLTAVKERVNLARDLDKLQLQVRKANSEEGWLEKAAKEMDIIIDGISKKYDSKETNRNKKSADFKRKQLNSLLENEIFPKGFSGKFPLSENSHFALQPAVPAEKAIEVMKTAMESKTKKPIRLYKPKSQPGTEKNRNLVIKLNKTKIDKKRPGKGLLKKKNKKQQKRQRRSK